MKLTLEKGAVGSNKAQIWRLGALALFCGLPLLFVSLSVSNLMEASAARDLAERQRTTLSQIVKQVAKRQARSMTAQDKASLYLASTSATLARAELQDTVTKAIAASGGRLVEAQFTSTPESEADGAVAIQMTLDIDNKGLLELLYSIETALPLLQATDLSARSDHGQSEGGAGPADTGTLRVDLTVQGRWRKNTG